jgi:hypothetical protein
MSAKTKLAAMVTGLCLAFSFTPAVALADPGGSALPDIQPTEKWGQFVSQRTDMLENLAPPIEDCISRPAVFLPGYTSPMFGGCVDWHSNVHAMYSMYVLYGETKDKRYLDIAESKIKDELVPAELQYMQTAEFRGRYFSDLENPYGMAWFLALAEKREEVTGNTSLRPIADYAAQRIRTLLQSLSPQEYQRQILVPAHYNLTWGIINLHLWAEYTGDEELLGFMDQVVVPNLRDPALDEICPVTSDSGQNYEEFFPPCLMRIAGVVQTWTGSNQDLKTWVNDRVPPDFWVERVTNPVDWTGHKFGINFSRAYTLWYLWEATNNPRFRANYADLISYHVSRPELFDVEAGYSVSHFVPQFGVRAIEIGLSGR